MKKLLKLFFTIHFNSFSILYEDRNYFPKIEKLLFDASQTNKINKVNLDILLLCWKRKSWWKEFCSISSIQYKDVLD